MSKLTPELQERLCSELAKGKTIRGACGAVGIAEGTYYNWINKGKASKRSNKYKRFVEATNIAKQKGIGLYEDVIYKTAIEDGVWTCAAWYLERRVKDVYGKEAGVKRDVEPEVEISEDDVEWIEDVGDYNK